MKLIKGAEILEKEPEKKDSTAASTTTKHSRERE
jgi:hypothetical protein